VRLSTRFASLFVGTALLFLGSVAASAATRAPAGTWPMFRYDARHTGDNPTETTISTANVSTLKTKWTATTGFQTNLNSTPAVGGGRVYIGDGNGTMWAFDISTGGLDWSTHLGPGAIDTAPAVAAGVVYVGDCDTITALRASDGTLVWSTTLDIPGPHGCDITSPTLASGDVYVGSYGSKGVHALRASDGKLLWSSEPTGGPITSSPAVANGAVFAGSQDGSVYAYPERCSTPCAPLWSHAVGSEVEGAPAVAHGTVFVGDDGGAIDALDEATGAQVWRRHLGGQVIASPAVLGNVVFASGTGGDLAAFRATDGAQLWDLPFAGGSGSPAVANGVLYISASGNVEGFDAKSGHFLWDGFVVSSTSSPVVTGGRVYASVQGVSSGTLYSWGLP